MLNLLGAGKSPPTPAPSIVRTVAPRNGQRPAFSAASHAQYFNVKCCVRLKETMRLAHGDSADFALVLLLG